MLFTKVFDDLEEKAVVETRLKLLNIIYIILYLFHIWGICLFINKAFFSRMFDIEIIVARKKMKLNDELFFLSVI